jgi:hypothetical protein
MNKVPHCGMFFLIAKPVAHVNIFHSFFAHNEDGRVAGIRTGAAPIRNRFMADLAEEIMIASAVPSGPLPQ